MPFHFARLQKRRPTPELLSLHYRPHLNSKLTLFFSQAVKAGTEGQRLTKVDRSDDIVAPQKLDGKIAEAIKNRRAQEGYKMTQAQLAQKVNVPANDIKQLESGSAIKNQALLNKVARVLKISAKTGEPLPQK